MEVYTLQNKSTRYYIGDLKFTQSDNDYWRQHFVSEMFKGNKNGNQGILTHKGYQYFVANTGCNGYFTATWDEEDNEYLEVTGGNIGVMPMELVTKEDIEDYGIVINTTNPVVRHKDMEFFNLLNLRISLIMTSLED